MEQEPNSPLNSLIDNKNYYPGKNALSYNIKESGNKNLGSAPWSGSASIFNGFFSWPNILPPSVVEIRSNQPINKKTSENNWITRFNFWAPMNLRILCNFFKTRFKLL